MRIAIHQPNFMPWVPFFEKIRQCDRFVILRHCQYESGNYQNRFQLGGDWYTMSVKRGLVPICSKFYANPHRDWAAIKRKLGRYSTLDEFDSDICESLAATNIAIILRICKKLDINTEIVFDYETNLRSTDRLVDLCKHFGATTYLSGQGGSDYLEASVFVDSGITVEFQKPNDKRAILEVLSTSVG